VWEESSGEAEIYTFSLMRKSATGPYAIGYVTLKEGPSLLTNFVDCDMDGLKIGQKVKVVFSQPTAPRCRSLRRCEVAHARRNIQSGHPAQAGIQ